jgi:AI-2 transport protein TqsA
MSLSKIAYSFIIIFSSVTALIYAKPLLIPFILALIIWFLIKELRVTMKRSTYIFNKIPEGLLTVIASFLIFFILGMIVKMITNNIQMLSLNLKEYEANIDSSIISINNTFEIDLLQQLKGFTEGVNFSKLFKIILNSLRDLFSNAFMILLYVVFLILEESVFKHKIKAIYRKRESFLHATALLAKIDKSIADYLTLKTIVSLLTGGLSYLVLFFMKVDAPVFWAFLIFLLNYIPTVGSLIATLFPSVFALLQFGDFTASLYVLGLVGLVQVVVGNIIEPKIMGSSLNISSLVVILSLSFWGSIWGITGMILSVPITVVMIIMCAEFPQTQFIAIILSEKGRIN